jgi:hypothetical protein
MATDKTVDAKPVSFRPGPAGKALNDLSDAWGLSKADTLRRLILRAHERVELALDSVVPDLEEGTLKWELRVLPWSPTSDMIVVVTDDKGEVDNSELFDRAQRRNGRSRRISPLGEVREFYAATAIIRDVFARWEATRALGTLEALRG